MSNTFGKLFRLTSFGESHGVALGGVIDGVPAGLRVDEVFIQRELDARKPGQPGQSSATSRREPDKVEILSGVFEGKSTGTPIGFCIRNTNQHSADYEKLKNLYRPGHADFGFDAKYGFRDYRGGGRSSGRETAARVVGGAVASLFLREHGIALAAYTEEFGGLAAPLPNGFSPFTDIQDSPLPFYAPIPEIVPDWEELVQEAKEARDSIGGVVRLVICGVPAGLGEPVFDKLDARIASAMFGVGTVKGVEIGAGFASARLRGSVNNDSMYALPENERSSANCGVGFKSNNAGGILGGISTGQNIEVRVALKPIASIGAVQHTVTRDLRETELTVSGRHDVSVIPRAVPVLKAMLAMTLADFTLLAANNRI